MGKSTCVLNLHLLQQESGTVLWVAKTVDKFQIYWKFIAHYTKTRKKMLQQCSHVFKCLKCVLHSDVKNVV